MTRMRVLRLIRGMTQLEVARRVGVSQGQISLIERGQVPATDAQRAAIAEALGVSRRGLFERARADDLDWGRDDD